MSQTIKLKLVLYNIKPMERNHNYKVKDLEARLKHLNKHYQVTKLADNGKEWGKKMSLESWVSSIFYYENIYWVQHFYYRHTVQLSKNFWSLNIFISSWILVYLTIPVIWFNWRLMMYEMSKQTFLGLNSDSAKWSTLRQKYINNIK